jgi:transposase
MIPLPLLEDNPAPATAPTDAAAPTESSGRPRHAAPPWDHNHLTWLILDADIPEDHLARFVLEFVAQLDLQPLLDSYAGRGSLPCSPELLLRLVFFCYLRKRPSPEQWLEDVRDSLPVRWLLFGLKPARSTLYAFRDRIDPFIDGWHQQLLEVAVYEGYTTGQRAGLDGSFLRARASRHHLLGEKGLRRHCQLLEEAIADDQMTLHRARRPLCLWTCWWVLVTVAVSVTPSPAAGAAALEMPSPAQLVKLLLPPRLRPAWMAGTPGGRQEQLRGLRRATRRWRAKKKQQEAKCPCRRKNKRGKGEKKVVVCVSEPEAAVGRDKHKVCRPLYNVQIARDLDSEFILGFGTFTAVSDSGLLPVMMERCKKLLGWLPSEVAADHSYATALDFAYCVKHDITLYAPLDPMSTKPAKPDRKYGKEEFRYDAERDVYVCPAGEELRPGQPHKEKRTGGKTVETVAYQARKSACAGCGQRDRCTKSKKGRIIKRSEHERLLEESRLRLASFAGKTTYRLRKQTVELSIANLKRLLGEDQPLSSYGKPRARVQVGLATLLLNALALFRARQRACRLPPAPDGLL